MGESKSWTGAAYVRYGENGSIPSEAANVRFLPTGALRLGIAKKVCHCQLTDSQ